MPTYTYSCGCGWRGDRRAGYDAATIVLCPSCGLLAAKEDVYRPNFGGFASTPRDQRTYWQEFKDFDEAGAELEYKHSRLEEAAGKQLPTPPLASIAKTQARELIAKGVKSSEDWKERQKH